MAGGWSAAIDIDHLQRAARGGPMSGFQRPIPKPLHPMKTNAALHLLRAALRGQRVFFGFAMLAATWLSAGATVRAEVGTLTGEKAIAHLKSAGQYDSLSAAIAGALYAVKPAAADDAAVPAKAFAQTPAHGLSHTFSGEGLSLTVRVGEGANATAHTVGWRLRSLGYGEEQAGVPAGALRTAGQRVEIARATPAVTEWFVNAPTGLEHGFTLPARPAADSGGEPLRVIVEVTGDLTPQAAAAGQTIALLDAAGSAVLSYARLKVWDATGTEFPATIAVSPARKGAESRPAQVILSVADANAHYPLTIDPTFTTTQQAYLKASNTDANDNFGWSVAVSGDTLVVGAPAEDSNATGVNGDGSNNSFSYAGAAYVFVRSGTTWTQQAYLKASNTGGNDQFGTSVAISGDTVVVGAPGERSGATGINGDGSNNSVSNAGAAYVFTRSGVTWTEQAYLKASNTGVDDSFGFAVAAADNTVVVGAPGESSNATGINGNQANNGALGAGAAYVFVRSGVTWAQQAYLKASNTGAFDNFGISVSISGDSAAVGARGEDSNATGVNGNQAGNSAPASGAAYVFVRASATWSQQAYLKASNTGSSDGFGSSLAMSGDTVVVGALDEASNATGIDGDQTDNSASSSGAAYIFIRSGVTWSQQAYLKASNSEVGDVFGASVAISGDTLIVGAWGESSNATGVNGNQTNNSLTQPGAAYVFMRSGAAWSQQAYLKASNTGTVDLFGHSVGLSGDTVVVGAYYEASNATGVNGDQGNNSAPGAGAAYVFTTPFPEIAVEQPPGTDLFDGDLVFVGNVFVGANTSLTFTVKNTGTADLTGLGITITGTDAAMFTVTAGPTAPVASGGSATFTVQFAPTSAGLKDAVLHIANNDANENPFDLTLVGIGLLSTDANLSNLTLSAGTLTPAFVATTASYAASVPFSTSSLANQDRPASRERRAGKHGHLRSWLWRGQRTE